jgi:hypothetical protein
MIFGVCLAHQHATYNKQTKLICFLREPKYNCICGKKVHHRLHKQRFLRTVLQISQVLVMSDDNIIVCL